MPKSSVYPDLERKKGGPDNWVEAAGGLPSYIERIAKHLHYEKGHSISSAIAMAVNTVKKWATGFNHNGGKLKPDTVAKAAAAVAEWTKKKASAAGKRLREDIYPSPQEVEGLARAFAGRVALLEGVIRTLDTANGVANAKLLLESEETRIPLRIGSGGRPDPNEAYRAQVALGTEIAELRLLLDGLDPSERILTEALEGDIREDAWGGKPGPNAAQVGPHARKKLSPLIKHFMSKPHPFGSCVRANTKRFGKERAERVCAVLKDLGTGTTHWRKGGKHVSEADVDAVITDLIEAGMDTVEYVDLIEGFLYASDRRALEEAGRMHPATRPSENGADGKAQPAKGAPDAGPLKHGAKGDRVVHLQNRLNVLGEDLRVDGDFGAKTDAAVRSFQHRAALRDDGEVGQKTTDALRTAPDDVSAADGEETPGVRHPPEPVGDAGGETAPEPSPRKAGPAPPLWKGVGVGEARPSAHVKELQGEFGDLGYTLDSDGRFGPETEKVVKRFQRKYGLKTDGIAGEKTRRTMKGAKNKSGELGAAIKARDGALAESDGAAYVRARARVTRLVEALDEKTVAAVERRLREADGTAEFEKGRDGGHRRLKCPKCGHVQSAVAGKCRNCGHDMTAARKAKFAHLAEEYGIDTSPGSLWADLTESFELELARLWMVLDEAAPRPSAPHRVQEATLRGAARKAISLKRLPDGTFAPRGRGQVLEPGMKVKVPHKSGTGTVNGEVRPSAGGIRVDLLDGPDKGAMLTVKQDGSASPVGQIPGQAVSAAIPPPPASPGTDGEHITDFEAAKAALEKAQAGNASPEELATLAKKARKAKVGKPKPKAPHPSDKLGMPTFDDLNKAGSVPVGGRFKYEDSQYEVVGTDEDTVTVKGLDDGKHYEIDFGATPAPGYEGPELRPLDDEESGTPAKTEPKPKPDKPLPSAATKGDPAAKVEPPAAQKAADDAMKSAAKTSDSAPLKQKVTSVAAKLEAAGRKGAADTIRQYLDQIDGMDAGKQQSVGELVDKLDAQVGQPTTPATPEPSAPSAQGGLQANTQSLSLKDLPPGTAFTVKGEQYVVHKNVNDPWLIAKPLGGGKAKPFHNMLAPPEIGPLGGEGGDATPAAPKAAGGTEGDDLFDKLSKSVDIAAGAKEKGQAPDFKSAQAAPTPPAPAPAPTAATPQLAALQTYLASGGDDPAIISALGGSPETPTAAPSGGGKDLAASPGRGPSGKLRNFKAMSKGKLSDVIADIESFGGDAEALKAAKAALSAK